MELSEVQKTILKNSTNKSLISASAGSGKTRLLTEKIRQLLKQGIEPTKIAVITFTNMAANEMRIRLGEDYKKDLYVGTIHGLANHFLIKKGIPTKDIIDKEEFDKLFILVNNNKNCIKKYEWILMDEAQDTSKLEFQFIFENINPKNFFLVYDIKQSIYQWKGACPNLLKSLESNKNIKFFTMNENYRNSKEILDCAKSIAKRGGMIDNSIAINKESGKVLQMQYSLETMIDKILLFDEYKDWAILVRTNQQITSISNYFKKNNIPYDTFKQGDLDNKQLEELMKKNSVKILTVHSAKGLEWKNVILIGLRCYPKEEINIFYVAITRAKNKLILMKNFKNKKS